MSSRMDRYYENHPEEFKRTRKNTNLYDDIYATKDYDNIEHVDLNVGKKIDIRDIKELLEKRENYNNIRDYQIVKPEEPVERKVRYYEEERTVSHDLNDLFERAKEERPIEEKRRHLEDTQVLTLQELVSKKSYAKKTKIDKEEIKDLINTIYDTNLLSSDNGDGLLDSLKGTGQTIVSTSIRQVLDDAKKIEKEEKKMDDSFFTSSMGFKDKELKEFKSNDEESIEESNSKTYTFLIILAIISILIFGFIIIKFML